MNKPNFLRACFYLAYLTLIVMPMTTAQAQISRDDIKSQLTPILYLLLLDQDNSNEPPNNTDNVFPTGSFSVPAIGTVFEEGDTVRVEVEANDTDGEVEQVSLFLNDSLVRTDFNAPHRWNSTANPVLADLTSGVNILRAEITDNEDAKTVIVIQVVNGVVSNAENLPPVGSFANPTPDNGATLALGASTDVSVAAADEDGTISQVRLSLNGEVISTQTSAPYRWASEDFPDLENLAPGDYSLAALITDDDGASISITRAFSVSSNILPTGSFAAPALGNTFMAGQSVNVDIEASDTDGDIEQVSLFINNTLVRTDRNQPYRFFAAVSPQLANLAAGSYNLRAVIVDDEGGQTTIEQVLTVIDTDLTRNSASRFLQQSTFGATTDDINEVMDRGIEGWINWQLDLPITSHVDYWDEFNDDESRNAAHINAWLQRAVNADDQLRQRVAYALSQLWVIGHQSVDTDDSIIPVSAYYDILLKHSFGNYREMMQEITLNPLMGEYLSMLGNQKPNDDLNIRPDENYAREIMQLFTIGLVELEDNGETRLVNNEPVPTYDLDVISGFSHVFTGWTWVDDSHDTFDRKTRFRDLFSPMRHFPEFHDTDPKLLLNGEVLPAGQTGEQDLSDALDNIFAHQNVAPFVSRSLITNLVTSNPSPEYIERVASVFNNNGENVKGDMAAVVKAVLMDVEARTGQTSSDKVFGKLKEPVLRLTALWRAFDGRAENGIYDQRSLNDNLAQAPLASPSVFNFYSPFFSPQGDDFSGAGLVAPELEIHSEATLSKMHNKLYFDVWIRNNLTANNPNDDHILIHVDRERALADNPDALMEHINELLMAGQMSDQMKQAIIEYLLDTHGNDLDRRTTDAIALVLTSAQFTVQK